MKEMYVVEEWKRNNVIKERKKYVKEKNLLGIKKNNILWEKE